MQAGLNYLKAKILPPLKLDHIDESQSLSFLKRNLEILPSDAIIVLLLVVCIILLLVDGCALFAAIGCFLLPALRCLSDLARKEQQIRPYSSEPSSHLTDEQFSQILQQQRRRTHTVEGYIVYFVFYIISEIISPTFNWMLGSVTWLLLRLLLTVAFLSDAKGNITARVLEFIGRHRIEEELPRRNAELSEKKL